MSTPKRFDLEAAIERAEEHAEKDPVAQALAAPHATAATMQAAPPGDLAAFRSAVGGMTASGLWVLIAQAGLQILQEYGPQALAYVLELLKRKIPVGP